MSWPAFPRDLQAEMFVPGTGWVDLGAYPLQRGSYRIASGRGSESTHATRSTCDGQLNNRDGRFSPTNPNSPYFEKIGLNTPFRLTDRTTIDTFGDDAIDGWDSADTGQVWSTFGDGGTVQASDYQVAAGVGTHSVPAADAYRATYLGGQVYRIIDVAVTVTVPFTDVTGGIILPACIMLRGQSTTDYYILRVVINTDETVGVNWGHHTTDHIPLTTIPGLTHSSAQALRVRAQIEGQTLRAKVWAATGQEPYEWHLTDSLEQAGAPDGYIMAAGWVGIRSGVGTGNTNAKPIVFSYDDLVVRIPEAAGEIADLPTEWDKSGVDVWTDFQAAGILRRLGATTGTLQSAPRRYINTVSPSTLVAYWPMEDGPLVDAAAPDVGIHQLRPFVGTHPSGAVAKFSPWAGGTLAPWLSPVARRPGSNTLNVLAAVVSMPSFAGEWVIDQMVSMTATTSETSVATDVNPSYLGGIASWPQMLFYPQTNEITISFNGLPEVSFSGRDLFDGAAHHVRWVAAQSGANVNWSVYVDSTQAGSGTIVTYTLPAITALGLVANGVDVVQGHVAVWTASAFPNDVFAAHEAAFGHAGEAAGRRLERLCDEESIEFCWWGDLDDTAPMGAQGPDRLISLLEECAVADRGTLGEPRGTIGIMYRPPNATSNLVATAALDYAQGDLAALDPAASGDFQIANKVTATRTNGGSYTASLDSGRLSTASPADGGIGEYAVPVNVNVASDAQVPHVAGWALRLGTVDETRYRRVRLNLGNSRYQTAAGAQARAAAAVALGVDDLLTVANPKSVLPPDTIAQLVRGVTTQLSRHRHVIDINTAPASPFEVFEVEHDTRGRLHTDGSVLAAEVTTTSTALSPAATAGWKWSTSDVPYDVRIGGERITVTASADELMSAVVAGTADHAVNASVAPGLPAGLVEGDLLVCLAAIRNSGAGVPVAPTGYTRWPVFETASNAQLFAKIATGSEVAPTVTFTGGVANADTSAQLIKVTGKFYDVDKLLVRSASALNASAQNVAYPGLTVKHPNCLILYLGWKQDDWTSVATIAGATEIGEPDTTTGDDQGTVWDYVIQTTPTHIPAGSFTVTGGASGISRGAVAALWCDRQAWTVTRSVNGIVKAHTAGAPVRLFSQHGLAL